MSRKHILSLDGVRGLAFLTVFVYHYGGGAQSSNIWLSLVGRITRYGWIGVSLFFVLSGFLITGILWDSRNLQYRWRNFYIRRTLRIFPLYYLALLLVLLSALFVHSLHQCLSSIWIFLFYLQNLPFSPDPNARLHAPLVVYHFWSLATEEQFYLFWPILLWLTRSRRQAKWLCATVFIGSIFYRALVIHYASAPGAYWGMTFARSGELAAGAWLALTIRGSIQERKLVNILSIPALVFCGVAFVFLCIEQKGLLSGVYIWGFSLLGIIFAAWINLAMQEGKLRRVMENYWLRQIGILSYGLYVYHVLLTKIFSWVTLHLAPHSSRNVQLGIQFFVAAVGSFVAAWLSFHLFELRFLRMKKKLAPDRTDEPLTVQNPA